MVEGGGHHKLVPRHRYDECPRRTWSSRCHKGWAGSWCVRWMSGFPPARSLRLFRGIWLRRVQIPKPFRPAVGALTALPCLKRPQSSAGCSPFAENGSRPGSLLDDAITITATEKAGMEGGYFSQLVAETGRQFLRCPSKTSPPRGYCRALTNRSPAIGSAPARAGYRAPRDCPQARPRFAVLSAV